jgi:hypothetical protein
LTMNQVLIAFVFGVSFVIALIALAIKFPRPTPFQYTIFRSVLALSAAGVAAMVPGFINVEITETTRLLIRAGGALQVNLLYSAQRSTSNSCIRANKTVRD